MCRVQKENQNTKTRILNTLGTRSPTLSPLEHASDILKEEKEGSPDYSRWVPSDYIGKMLEWLANINLGKPPSDEEEAWGRFGIRWAEEVLWAEAEAWQDFKDEEIKGLVNTHDSPVPHCR